MKTLVLLIVSSLFLSNMPNRKDNDTIEKIMKYKVEKIKGVNTENNLNVRTPIIIVKLD